MTTPAETGKKESVYKVRNLKDPERDLGFALDNGENRTEIKVIVERKTGKQIVSWQLETPKAYDFLRVLERSGIPDDTVCIVGTVQKTEHKEIPYSELGFHFVKEGEPAYLVVSVSENTYHWHLSSTGGSTVAVTSDTRIDTDALRVLFDETNKKRGALEAITMMALDINLNETIEQAKQLAA